MMNRKILMSVLAVLLLSPLPTLAQGHGYGGASVGATWYESDVTVNNVVENFSESTTAWKIFGGYMSDAIIGVEGGYRNLGSTNTEISGEYIRFATSGWDVELLGRVQISIVDIFGKLGSFFYKTETNYGDQKKTGLLYGLGASVRLGPVGLRLEWEYLDVESPDSLSMATAGVTFGF